jgi:hypothetical protein
LLAAKVPIVLPTDWRTARIAGERPILGQIRPGTP